MNKMPFFKKSILFLALACLFSFSSMFAVFAETESTETYAIESYVPESTSASETDTSNTETTSEPTETASETGTSEETTAPTTPAPTYREPLPEITSEEIIIPEPVVDAKEEEPPLFWGFVAWICIGVGVAVVIAVLLTTKTKAMRSGGKKRYSTGDKISGKKRLLNDKYYNNQKRR